MCDFLDISPDISNIFIFAAKGWRKEILNSQFSTLNFFFYLCRLVRKVIDKTKFYVKGF